MTEETVSKQNHPLFFVDEHKNTQDVLNQYHFNLDASFSALGQLTKDSILDTWDHPEIGVDVLDYLNDIEDHTPIYFIVLSKDGVNVPVPNKDNVIVDTDEKMNEDKLDQVKNNDGKNTKGSSINLRKSKSNKKIQCVLPLHPTCLS